MRPYRSRFEVAACVALIVSGAPASALSQVERRFSVEDDIGLTVFESDAGSERAFSADHQYFALRGERGNLAAGLVEDTLWVYRTADVETYISSSGAQKPAPVMITRRLARKAPAIVDWQWASRGAILGFIDNSDPAHRSLLAVDVPQAREIRLSPEGAGVGVYHLRDPRNFVYTRFQDSPQPSQSDVASTVETGRDLYSILVPQSRRRYDPPATRLISVRGGVTQEIRSDGIPAIRQREAWMISPELIVSPDGTRAITEWSVESAPPSWERLYLPMDQTTSIGVHEGDRSRTYVQIDLLAGTVRPLIDAPSADAGGWWLVPRAAIKPKWASDGRYVLFPESYVPSVDAAPSEPCVAVFDTRTDTMACVDKVRRDSSTAQVPELMERADFVAGRPDRVRIVYRAGNERLESRIYVRDGGGRWTAGSPFHAEQARVERPTRSSSLAISVVENLNTPPRVEVRRGGRTRVLLAPNDGLSSVVMGKVEVYHWSEEHGRTWRGGLFLPPDYQPGSKYPLVIQTHGFADDRFVPSGYVPTAFAALALASHGIVVLQVDEQCGHSTPEEMDCAAAAYRSAARALSTQGIVDPARVGLIGFSRTCLYVMRTLTAGGFQVAAASVNDGVLGTYSQYILNAGFLDDMYARDGNTLIGAPPFGEGLQQWFKRSPGFNLDRVTAPLLVTAESPENILYMWEVYAGLHFLKKPVELVMLNIDEHVFSNPLVRLASQGGTVDWFRFWLKGEEDPDPAKAEQYRRWRSLRNRPGMAESVPPRAPAVSAKAHDCRRVAASDSTSMREPTLRCTGAG
jgi:dipeptidyl aminopeptidase/acylaminoacyl peptidase